MKNTGDFVKKCDIFYLDELRIFLEKKKKYP